MLRKSLMVASPAVYLSTRDKKKVKCMSNYIIAQCCLVFVGALTIIHCVWHPNRLPLDNYKLACIMYLFDRSACGYTLGLAKNVKNLRFSNDTMGLDVLPITWKPADVTVSSRLSTKVRGHLDISRAMHIIWMLLAITARIVTRNNNNPKFLRHIITTMLYGCIIVVGFDLSMAIVYVAHIKQSVTKGMIIRHSGWTVELKTINYDDFGGWLPIAASLAWMKGVIFLALNVYCIRTLYYLSYKIRRREIGMRNLQEHNFHIPEPNRYSTTGDHILFFGPGELKPEKKKDVPGSYY